MHGNVWEWCEDYYGDYDKLPRGKNPVQIVNLIGFARVLRGGSWLNRSKNCRSADRFDYNPDVGLNYFGSRVVLSPQD